VDVPPVADETLAPERRREIAHTMECARRLRAAHDASVEDAGQQLLIRELMAHYGAWCSARALPDPFAALDATHANERVGRAERRMQQLAVAAIRRGTAPAPVDELVVPEEPGDRAAR